MRTGYDDNNISVTLDDAIMGYNPNPTKYKEQAIDRVAMYCHKNHISYGEYQRLEHFKRLPKDVREAGIPEKHIYIFPEKEICHGAYYTNKLNPRGKYNKKGKEYVEV